LRFGRDLFIESQDRSSRSSRQREGKAKWKPFIGIQRECPDRTRLLPLSYVEEETAPVNRVAGDGAARYSKRVVGYQMVGQPDGRLTLMSEDQTAARLMD
jgi:hypothetical protein